MGWGVGFSASSLAQRSCQATMGRGQLCNMGRHSWISEHKAPKPEPSKPRLPSSQILPFSLPPGCMELNRFELSSKVTAPTSLFRPAQPLLMPCPSAPPAVVLLLRFRVSIQGTFHPKPPAMIGTMNADISERLPATGREKKVISGAPFTPQQKCLLPRSLAGQGLLADCSKAW